MKRFLMQHGRGGTSELPGETLAEAIVANFQTLRRDLRLGNAAGYHLDRVRVSYREGILGGQGGISVEIWHRGLPLAHHPDDTVYPVQCAEVWMQGRPEDCPEPFNIEIVKGAGR